jgi:hippurate hydrolase
MDIERVVAESEELRRELHRKAELAYEEYETAGTICRFLEKNGIEYEDEIAGTGVVAWISKGESGPSIAFRADMDALPIDEENDIGYSSVHPGIMHACGHDGHMAIMLGAARLIKEELDFDGTVYFIFQPAEEGGAGAAKMIEEGLFEKFDIDRVYGLHNRPEARLGTFLIKDGPVMSSVDTWEITISGKSGHSSQPHRAINPIVVASHIVLAIKSISSQDIDPSHSHVVTVAKIESGSAFNIIPDICRIEGSVRSFDTQTQDTIEKRIRELAEGIASAFGAGVRLEYRRMYPATINSFTLNAKRAALAAGASRVEENFPSSMGSEDFSFFLRERPGCYVWLGTGDESQERVLHSAGYDFNDKAIEMGIKYWYNLAAIELGRDRQAQKRR